MDRETAQGELEAAASQCGLEPDEARSTTARGLQDGLREHDEHDDHSARDSDRCTQEDIRLALGQLGARVMFDRFQNRVLVEGVPGIGPLLDDPAMIRLWLLSDETLGKMAGKDFFWAVVTDEARRNGFHPLLDYLDGLQWDGTPRLDDWLCAYGGAEDTPYVRAVGALLLIAAVRRVRNPGCKYDEMVVLESSQGTNKSSALALMAVKEEWFSDDLPLDADGKRQIEALQGCWIVEAAELQGLKRGDVEKLKAFLSRRIDRGRMAYERLGTEVPRQCVIVGTTNSNQYLRDETGNRRFWPVQVKGFDLEALARDRDQLWAEAVVREARGDPIRLDPALWPAAAAEQEQRVIEDPYLHVLAAAFGQREGKIKAAQVFDLLNIRPGDRTQHHNVRVGQAMQSLGWRKEKRRFHGGPPVHAYVKGPSTRTLEADPEGRRVYDAEEDAELPI